MANRSSMPVRYTGRLHFTLMALLLMCYSSATKAANIRVERTCRLLFIPDHAFQIQFPVSTLAKRYERAEKALQEFHQVIEKIRTKTSVEVLPPVLKSKDRFEEKAQLEYGGDFNQIHDLVRATLIVSDLSRLKDVIQAIDQSAQIIKFRDRMSSRDYSASPEILIVINLPNSQETAEIMVQHRLYRPVQALAHKQYQIMRSHPDPGKRAVAKAELAKILPKVHEALDLEASIQDLPHGRVVYSDKSSESNSERSSAHLPVYQAPERMASSRLAPQRIRFARSSVSNLNTENEAFSVIVAAKALKAGTLKLSDLPPIRVWQDTKGRVWTQDLHSLASLRLAGVMEVPVIWSNEAAVSSRNGKFTTTNNGKSIIVQITDAIGIEVR